MKHATLILFLSFFASLQAQRAFTFHTRPTQMGYCLDNSGELNCFAGIDLTGYLMHIHYMEDGPLKIILYQNGKIIEDIHSSITAVFKVTKKQLSVICNNFVLQKSRYLPVFSGEDHKIELNVLMKTKKGTIRFTYPEEKKVYSYFFDVL